MPQDHQDPATTADASTPPATRIAFERLRERTDELELLVSGLFAFALLTVPGRAFDAWARASIHVEGVLDIIIRFGFQIAVGLGYALGFAFIAHLAIRAYWIGLIGLKSTFPDGIRWERVPLIGSVTRPFYQRQVGDLGHTIDRVDRAASILFSMTTLIALLLAWIGVQATVGLALCGLVGRLFQDQERASYIAMGVGYVLFLAVTLTPMLLDRLVARREAAGRSTESLRRLAERLLRLMGWFIPQRLIYAVQFTLQSNLPGRSFMTIYVVVSLLAMMSSLVLVLGSARLSLFDSYQVLTTETVDHGMLGAHYESLRGPEDRLAFYPMIPSDRVSDTHLRLFIPHRPQRDNPLARERCTALPGGRNAARGAAAVSAGRDCLAAMWTLTLDGAPLSLDDFVPTERRDLGMRGLLGYIEVSGLRTGRHELRLSWNAEGGDSGPLRRRDYVIPFWFTPAMDQPAGGAD